MKTVISVLGMCLLCLMVFAQDAKEDLKAMQAAYKNTPHFQASITIKGLQENGQWLELGTGKWLMQGQSYYSTGMDKEIIANAEGSLVVDHLQREMVYFPKRQKVKPMAQFFDINALITQYDSVVYLGIQAKRKGYRFYQNGSIESYDLWLDAKDLWLLEVNYRYAPEMRQKGAYYQQVVIQYSIDMEHVPAAKHFALNRFVTTTDRGLQPLAEYTDYSLTTAANLDD